ncbi:MAG: alpha-galactosidase [Acidobacteria bacterium]|nr:alpha-galactosidase [Acidobacteriota bacterium]
MFRIALCLLAASSMLDAAPPPFSFVYGGKKSADLLPGWRVRSAALGADREEFLYADPVTKLEVRVEVKPYKDFPAVEWLLRFRNAGTRDTPMLAQVMPLDAQFAAAGAGNPVIHYAKGAVCSRDDFMPLRRVLNKTGALELHAGGGRSSSDFLPFFNVEFKPDEGVMLGIGWSGEWMARFSRERGPEFRAAAGMALTHLSLRAGEEIRTPRIVMLQWQGDRLRGHNLLRRFLMAHARPRANGAPVEMPVANGNWGATPAAVHLENIARIAGHRLPIDVYWIDAEWFGKGRWFMNPGNWAVKRDVYPQGFKPISDRAHEAGMKFLLWFEPERICEGSAWHREHPQWTLEVPKGKRVYNWGTSQADPMWVVNESHRNQIVENDRLLNLADPAARRFLTDFICARIKEFGIDWYRHDANIAPLEFWRAADAPNRQGITEIRWVEGLYEFWDELLRRNPGLAIDNCASGGRRIDIESLRRSLPLWRTDYPGENTAKQCHTYGLNFWVPVSSTGAGILGSGTEYELRSSMSSGLALSLFDQPSRKGYDLTRVPWQDVQTSLERYKTIQHYFTGDYYPLTEYSQAEDAWMAYQFDVPEKGEGLVVALKRPLSRLGSGAFPLRALSAGAYEVTDLDTGKRSTVDGARLSGAGLEISLDGRPASGLMVYRRLRR